MGPIDRSGVVKDGGHEPQAQPKQGIGWALAFGEIGVEAGVKDESSQPPKKTKSALRRTCWSAWRSTVTGDAMFTQRDLSRHIDEAGGQYVWKVKDNQPTLRADIERLLARKKCR